MVATPWTRHSIACTASYNYDPILGLLAILFKRHLLGPVTPSGLLLTAPSNWPQYHVAYKLLYVSQLTQPTLRYLLSPTHMTQAHEDIEHAYPPRGLETNERGSEPAFSSGFNCVDDPAIYLALRKAFGRKSCWASGTGLGVNEGANTNQLVPWC
ncbi:hypothetical protein CPC08DRAFT_718630 [Agrocybe pediades]|nr:hypothetical protein CPC08DRAFT_718630 [Agrocybe pediades]